MNQIKVLIAGGSGIIGSELQSFLKNKGYSVAILSRSSTNEKAGVYHWNLDKMYIDPKALKDVQHLINLTGESVSGKRWSKNQKQKIIDSRTKSADCLFQHFKDHRILKTYTSASGINAYPMNQDQVFEESEAMGYHFLAEVISAWEESADQFSRIVPVCKLRTGIVFSPKGGALQVMAKPFQYFVGTALGTGKQMIPWTDSMDLCRLFTYSFEKELSGTYNAINGNVSNKDLSQLIARVIKRPLWPFNVPSIVLKMILGEQSTIALDGLSASNNKLKAAGFNFQHDLEQSLQRSLINHEV